MSKKTRSARGEIVDFDLLAIKQQLAAKPVPVSVDQRRRFIDEKDGIKMKVASPARSAQVPAALAVAAEAVEASAAAEPNEQLEEESEQQGQILRSNDEGQTHGA